MHKNAYMFITIVLLAVILPACIANNVKELWVDSFPKFSQMIERIRNRRFVDPVDPPRGGGGGGCFGCPRNCGCYANDAGGFGGCACGESIM